MRKSNAQGCTNVADVATIALLVIGKLLVTQGKKSKCCLAGKMSSDSPLPSPC
jgi:hypothetical protein